jgi:hypothetical protein
MRESSRYALQYEDKYGRRAHPLTGAIHFLNCKSISELVRQASKGEASDIFKFNQYNFQGFLDRELRLINSQATIEFRQHEGSMNAEPVVNWIKTAVGIVEYVKNIDYSSLTDLLRIVEYETWEKIGDGKDDEREAKFGPILAESKFTIIDLLSHIKLWGPANYYRKRWRKLTKKPRLLPTPIIEWEYESTAVPGSKEYEGLRSLRKIWEEDRIVAAAQLPGGWEFDPDHITWPKHEYLVDDWDAATDRDAEEPQVARRSRSTAANPNQPSLPLPPQPQMPKLNGQDQLPKSPEEDFSAEEAELDQQLKELADQDAADTMDAEDTEWRERLRREFGNGVIPRGSMNPFDDSLPRIRRWRGRGAQESPDVSPKTKVEDEESESDEEMPFFVGNRP